MALFNPFHAITRPLSEHGCFRDPRPATRDPRPSTLDPRPSTLASATLDPPTRSGSEEIG